MKTKDTIWGILVILFFFIYTGSVLCVLSLISVKIGIYYLDIFLGTIFLLMTIGLLYHFIENPSILFLNAADKKRAIITKKVWNNLKNIPEEKLDLLEKNIREVIYSIENL